MQTLNNNSRKLATRIFSYICATFSLAMIVTQFLPFWGCYECRTCGEAGIISINEYVWFPVNHKYGLTSILSKYYIADFAAMDVAGTCAFLQVAAVLSIVFAILKPKKLISAVFCIAGGVIGVVGYLTGPAYQLGQMWLIHVVIFGCAILAGLSSLLVTFCKAYSKAKAEIAAENSKQR